MKETHMAERSERDKTQSAILTMVGDWESSCRLDFIEDLLNELDDEALAKIAEQQGVELQLTKVAMGAVDS